MINLEYRYRTWSDPAKWEINEYIIDYICKNGYSQNLDSGFSQSKRIYQSVVEVHLEISIVIGDNENIGSPHNGNFMMCLKLIAEFDPFLANHLSNYVEEVISAQYFSIIIDSTPDIAHVDQLSFILRGQSYDNAKNMSGLYSGLQARIKEISPLADFVPCSAHSLNLNIYTFFAASTHRWNLLKVNLTLKSLSDTRWSARDDACKALNQNWDNIKQSLCDILENINEKPNTHNEARGLLKLMNRFEVTFMSLFWDDMFTHYEKLALRMCKNKYETIYKRIKRRSKYHDETTNDNEINLAGSLEFKISMCS
ncbi:uncharacterized protein LOC112683189 [Sipha flava]|uniref:Uncharacterized protein LOC112683189 n=1 Tax=Sipha flava TaxID=143950 RepID=A0A8B8FHQ3_9HEMI|nr:uncharacterized protein LOC112683189 [Sipha flava]